MTERTAPKWLRPATEYGPLVVFFAAFYAGDKDLITATAAFMVAVVVVVLCLAVWRQKPPTMFVVTTAIVLVFGALTLWFEDERFIKMKPTIVQALFAAVLLGGLFFKRPLLKPLLESAWPLQDRGWWILSRRFAIFFILMAALNEAVWRNFSTELWLNFKVFGILILTFVFTACQMPLFTRYKIERDEDSAAEE
ncbi:MAG TPA: septation protein A [Rhodospirillaceae bacterium]|nr:septation protein A [Rhodospirillaceae bacterium]HAA93429.1 septation protein A [Rhodospirillaceae bacterium]HAT34526.1 septation protein A [Rhodospirillaceae bacterium]